MVENQFGNQIICNQLTSSIALPQLFHQRHKIFLHDLYIISKTELVYIWVIGGEPLKLQITTSRKKNFIFLKQLMLMKMIQIMQISRYILIWARSTQSVYKDQMGTNFFVSFEESEVIFLIPDEASNGAVGVNSENLFCCKQNVLDLIMELFFMLVKYRLYYMKILIENMAFTLKSVFNMLD